MNILVHVCSAEKIAYHLCLQTEEILSVRQIVLISLVCKQKGIIYYVNVRFARKSLVLLRKNRELVLRHAGELCDVKTKKTYKYRQLTYKYIYLKRGQYR